MKLKIFGLSLLLSFYMIGFSQTTINVSNTVTNENPLPFGLNWAEGNAARNLNALNNHTGDPGFGRQIIRLKGTCDGGGSTYAEHAIGDTKFDYWETLYTGMFDGGNIRIYRETANGIIKIRDEAITTFFADTINGFRANFATGTTVQAGDIYVISIESNNDLNQFCHPRLTWIRDGANTWDKKVDDQYGLGNVNDVTKSLTTDVPVNGGTTSCKIVNTNANNIDVGIGQYFSNSPLSGEFAFNPSKTYRFTIWMKQSGISNGTVNLHTTQTNINHSFTVTNTWQEYTYDVSGINPCKEGAPVDVLNLTFGGTGTLWIDNFTMHDVSYPLYALSPAIKQELVNFKPYDIRIWSGQTNQEMGTNIGDWTDTELQSAKLWSVNMGPVSGAALKLPSILPICEENNIAPYLICSPSFSEADFLGLMEYLGGPVTSTFGAKRASQGHPATYTSTLSKIYIELGNETWNSLFAPWTYDFNAILYGKFAQYFYNVIKSSPYYDATKFELVVGGFFVQSDSYGYGQQAVTTTPDAKQMMLANYIGGFDGLNIPASLTFADSIQQTAFYARWITRNLIDEHVATCNTMTTNGNPFQLGIYEAGPGYALPNPGTPFNLQAEAIGKSLACAVANLDAFLYQSEKGFALQNLFLFANGFNWSSHSSESQGLRPHNHFLALQMRNNYAKGQMITTNVTGSPTTYMPLIDANGNATYDGGYGEAPAGDYENIASYSFKDGSDYSIFVLNRNISNNIPVTINLPIGAIVNSLKLYKLTGDPTQSNIEALNFTIQEENFSIPSNSTNYSFTMPAGSIYLFKSSSVTGISELEKKQFVNLYPNPTTNELNISINEPMSLSILLVDVLGNELHSVYIENQNLLTIDISHLKTGLYFLKMTSSDKIQTYKFIKN